MDTALHIAAFLLSFCAMEFVAWLTHKYLMHGILWGLHRDHHKRDHQHFLERNDTFFLIFATPGIALIWLGTFGGNAEVLLWIGAGISFYGLAYFFIHEIFIHQRIKILSHTRNPYLRAVRRAHKLHHKHLDRENGESFGMLWVPARYYSGTAKGRD